MGSIKKINLMHVITIILLMIVTMINFEDNVSAKVDQKIYEKYRYFDIRSAPTGYTGADMDEMFRNNNHGDSILAGKGNKIFLEAQRNGVNPAFMFGMMILETGWGKDSKATVNNNFGGIRATKNRPGGTQISEWAYFETVDAGIEEQAKLLGSYTVKGPVTAANPKGLPLHNFQEVVDSYAPASENDQPAYISTVGKILDSLGQEAGGSLLTPDSSLQIVNSDGSLGEEGRRIQSEYFLTTTIATDYGGIQLGDAHVGTEVSNWVFTFSEGVRKLLMNIGGFLSAALLVYMVVYVLMHLVLLRNGLVSPDIVEKLRMPTEVQMFWPLMKRLGIGILFIAFFWSGLHVDVMAWIITFIGNLPIF